MEKIDPLWFSILSELFVNLSAVWYSAVFVGPNFSGITPPFNFVILTADVLAGTLCLLIAFRLKKLAKEEK